MITFNPTHRILSPISSKIDDSLIRVLEGNYGILIVEKTIPSIETTQSPLLFLVISSHSQSVLTGELARSPDTKRFPNVLRIV